MALKHMKRCAPSLTIGEMQNEISMGYNFNLAKNKRLIALLWRAGENDSPEVSLRRSVHWNNDPVGQVGLSCRYLKCISCDPTILMLGTNPADTLKTCKMAYC